MINLADITFYANHEHDDPVAIIEGQKNSYGYIDYIKRRIHIQVIKHLKSDATVTVNGVVFTFFTGGNRFWHIPFKALRHMAKKKPDVALVQGLGFPLQVMLLRLSLGKKPVIIAQHHGERPFAGLAGRFQKMADRCINAYFFTSAGNTLPWIERKLMRPTVKCFEVLEASTYITKQDRQESKNMLGITGDGNMLWVGRLEQNKDPLTVLYGFEKYLLRNPQAKLYMIYQEDILLNEVTSIVAKNEALKTAVSLIGRIDHEKLCYWYSASDIYISGSHREGSGYALIEAMACGCIPVVTDIPSFRAITGNGGCAILYQKGNTDDLLEALMSTERIDKEAFSNKVVQHFNQKLSFEAIANDIYNACVQLTGK